MWSKRSNKKLVGVLKLLATVTEGNEASYRVLEKSGFVKSRIIPNNDTIRGIKYSDVEYGGTDQPHLPGNGWLIEAQQAAASNSGDVIMPPVPSSLRGGGFLTKFLNKSGKTPLDFSIQRLPG